MSGNVYATLQRTVDAVVAAYSSPEPWNPDQIWATRTDDCMHYIHPKAAIPESLQAINKNDHVQALESLGRVLEKFELQLRDTVIDVQTKTVVINLAARYDLVAVGDQAPDRGLTTEFMWLMEMDESGEKIKRVEEFLDQPSFLALLTERVERHAETQK